MDDLIIIFFFVMAAFAAVLCAIAPRTLPSALLSGMVSMASVLCYLTLDAPDVALTEVAVGVCLSTFIMVGAYAMKQERLSPRVRHGRSLAVVGVFGALLLYYTLGLPSMGDSAAPIHHGASAYYLAFTDQEMGIPSVVAAILASYRGLDTLGEVLVILIAGLGVVAILPAAVPSPVPLPKQSLVKEDPLAIMLCHVGGALALLYGGYILMHGEISPGGGFQAGVIIATIFIVHSAAYGYRRIALLYPVPLLIRAAATGVGLFVMVGVIPMIRGQAFLAFSSLHSSSVIGQKIGITVAEIGIGLTVSTILIVILSSMLGSIQGGRR